MRLQGHRIEMSINDFGTGYCGMAPLNEVHELNDVTLNVTSVPEPDTWALPLVGLCAIGRAFESHRR